MKKWGFKGEQLIKESFGIWKSWQTIMRKSLKSDIKSDLAELV